MKGGSSLAYIVTRAPVRASITAVEANRAAANDSEIALAEVARHGRAAALK